MKKALFITLVFSFILVVSCKTDKKENETKKEPEVEIVKTSMNNSEKLIISLEPKNNSGASGNIVFNEDNGKVTLTAVLSGLDEGEHAIHIHEKADCSSPDGKSTGGHWNPTAQPHGKWGVAEGYHKGDIGNFNANADGNGTITFSTDEWCIGCGDTTKDILGKAIIVHQGVDDFVTQPTGAAGGRISCGGIIK